MWYNSVNFVDSKATHTIRKNIIWLKIILKDNIFF